jgi:hypothetical protein
LNPRDFFFELKNDPGDDNDSEWDGNNERTPTMGESIESASFHDFCSRNTGKLIASLSFKQKAKGRDRIG